MASAFAELGVCDEITTGLDEIGWALPTDIQAEAVPLILGGGDVLMAAETGSGKTGAFCLPVIQIVQETKRESAHGGQGSKSEKQLTQKCMLNVDDRSDIVAVSPACDEMQCRDFRAWGGCRATWAALDGAQVYYEVDCRDEGLSRFGFGSANCDLNLGTCPEGYGFGGTGKKSNRRQFDSYGEAFGHGDIIGCLLDRKKNEIVFYKNGKDLGIAFRLPQNTNKMPLYALLCLKNAEVAVNFSGPFKYPPQRPFVPYSEMNEKVRLTPMSGTSKPGSAKSTQGLPMAIILEPSRELALQTERCIEDFSKYVSHPGVTSVCLVGGSDHRYQKQVIEEGVDIVVGTPGRLEDFISSGTLKLDGIRFFIVDECDGLLQQNQQRLIESIHRQCPQISPEGRRLQMIVASATLHNFNVKKLAQKLMSFPSWVDLKGEDAVPDTVHHCVALVDPKKDQSWFQLYKSRKGILTDDVHKHGRDQIQPNFSEEADSEGVKKLKGEYVIRVIKKHQMDQAIIFCRTKLDCDNLERYFCLQGGGPKSGPQSQFSCVCLHSDRKPHERNENLEKFKNRQVRFLICTDVAARGIDVKGVPYVINVTLPDDKANYLHRIGRVGRAKKMGLAISLVSTVKEKVWYHSNCKNRGRGCTNTNDVKRGGCTIWYDEKAILGEVEEHLKDTIEIINADTMDVPVNEFDGKVVYGEKNVMGPNKVLTGHYREMVPTLKNLQKLEKSAQTSFLDLVNREAGLIKHW